MDFEFDQNILDEFNALTVQATTDNTESLALDILNRIIQRTPVDFGRARAAWNISVNKENLKVPRKKNYEEKQQRKKRRKKGGKNPVIYQRSPVFSIPMPPFSKVIITNSLPYISRLEGGYSWEQAPQGMMALAVAEVMQRVKSGF